MEGTALTSELSRRAERDARGLHQEVLSCHAKNTFKGRHLDGVSLIHECRELPEYKSGTGFYPLGTTGRHTTFDGADPNLPSGYPRRWLKSELNFSKKRYTITKYSSLTEGPGDLHVSAFNSWAPNAPFSLSLNTQQVRCLHGLTLGRSIMTGRIQRPFILLCLLFSEPLSRRHQARRLNFVMTCHPTQ